MIEIAHVNIRVPLAQLVACRDFYCNILGLWEGPRPQFSSTGFWLYANGAPVVHLVGESRSEPMPERGHPALDHVSFRCTGFAATLATLDAHGIAYRISTVPGLDVKQVIFTDPVGVGIELAFEEEGDAGSPGSSRK